jgi:hypothetical protein
MGSGLGLGSGRGGRGGLWKWREKRLAFKTSCRSQKKWSLTLHWNHEHHNYFQYLHGNKRNSGHQSHYGHYRRHVVKVIADIHPTHYVYIYSDAGGGTKASRPPRTSQSSRPPWIAQSSLISKYQYNKLQNQYNITIQKPLAVIKDITDRRETTAITVKAHHGHPMQSSKTSQISWPSQ